MRRRLAAIAVVLGLLAAPAVASAKEISKEDDKRLHEAAKAFKAQFKA